MKTHGLHKHEWHNAGEGNMQIFEWCRKCGALKQTEMHFDEVADTVRIFRPMMTK